MDLAPRTPTKLETALPTEVWATEPQHGTPALAPRTIPAPATMPLLLDRALRLGAAPTLATVHLHGVACPAVETSATSMTPLHQVETTLLLLLVHTQPQHRASPRRHPAPGPTVLPHPVEHSAHRPRVACRNEEATTPRHPLPLMPLLLQWVSPPLHLAQVTAMMTLARGMMKVHLAHSLSTSCSPHLSYIPDTQKACRCNTISDLDGTGDRLHTCILL